MKTTSKQTKLNTINDTTIALGTGQEQTVEVLYQKMGNRWFAFSVQGEDVFVGSISQEEIDRLEDSYPIVGNS